MEERKYRLLNKDALLETIPPHNYVTDAKLRNCLLLVIGQVGPHLFPYASEFYAHCHSVPSKRIPRAGSFDAQRLCRLSFQISELSPPFFHRTSPVIALRRDNVLAIYGRALDYFGDIPLRLMKCTATASCFFINTMSVLLVRGPGSCSAATFRSVRTMRIPNLVDRQAR